MKKSWIYLVALFLSLLIAIPCFSQKQEIIKLPDPVLDGGFSLLQALKERNSTKKYEARMLTRQQLSNLLWAAFGINRSETGKRTAPSALNYQEIDIYVAMAEGLYVYAPQTHSLKQILSEDIRAMTGLQPYVKDAALNLVYVADLSKMKKLDEAQKVFYSAADTGFIGQNVYLLCASEGLGTVIRGSIDRETLSEKMNLKSTQKIILAQCVGIPK